MVIAAYGSRLKVRAGKPVLFDLVTRDEHAWTPGGFPYDAVVCDRLGGFVTLPELRWLADRGAVISLLNFEGEPILTAVRRCPSNRADRLNQTALP